MPEQSLFDQWQAKEAGVRERYVQMARARELHREIILCRHREGSNATKNCRDLTMEFVQLQKDRHNFKFRAENQ